MDSQKTRYWTVPKAQGAVKASFFSRALWPLEGGGDLWLRFSEIKEIISRTEGLIGDRTLSRALAGLVAMGGLKKRSEGKFSFYALVIQRSERIKASARAEGAAIEGAGAIGGLGDNTEGWAVYGVPEGTPESYRGRLKRVCRGHQEALREILSDVWDETIDSILKPARGRVSRKVFVAGARAIEHILGLQAIGSLGLAYSARFWGVVEGTVPGAQRAFQRGMGLVFSPEASLSERISVTLSKISGHPLDGIRPEIDKEFARLEEAGKSFKPLWDALTPKEQERAGRRVQWATAMTVGLTSVVHA